MGQDVESGLKKASLWGARRSALPLPDGIPASKPAPPKEELPREEPATAGDSRVYQAFETQERASRLNICCANVPSRYPAYGYLLDIIFENHSATCFTLIYNFMVVEVKGQNLQAVVHAIAHGSCGRIIEFDNRLYDMPAVSDPFIDSIEIITETRDEEHNGE